MQSGVVVLNKFWQQIKSKIKAAWEWLKAHLFTKEMVLPTIIGELIFWSPLIITGLMAILISPYYWVAFSAIYSVWVGLLPAIPIQLLFIFTVKKIIDKIKKNGDKK